jgi:hypothetical protein
LAQDKPKPSPKDFPSLKALAEKGDAEAQFMLGATYYFGRGVNVDFKLAVDWYKKSAKQGHPKAQFNLGSAYWYGKGVPKDPVQTYMWWTLSAGNGYPLAKEWMPKIEPHLTAVHIAEAKKLSGAVRRAINKPEVATKNPEPPKIIPNSPEAAAAIEVAIRERLSIITGEPIPKADLEKVTGLRLANKKLTDVKGLEKLTRCRVLYLNHNQLTSVKGLEKLRQLKTLYLFDNNLTDLKSLEKLTQLKELRLDSNQLTNVKGLEKLTKLRELWLADNQLTDVKGLEKLTQLKTLYLMDNPHLTKAQIDQLQKALPKCGIRSNPYLTKEESAKVIEAAIRKAAGNPTRELTKVDLEKVTSLYLGNNQLADVKGLEKLTQLEKLYLDNNQLTDVKGLEEFTKLRVLSLEDNPALTKAQIAELQKELPRCKIYSNPTK